MNYYNHLFSKVIGSLENCFYDNVDDAIRPRPSRRKIIKLANRLVGYALHVLGRQPLSPIRRTPYWEHLDEYGYLYDLLDDWPSKEKLIELLAYNLLGYQRVRLSIASRNIPRLREQAATTRRPVVTPVNFRNGYINKYDLRSLGYELELFCGDGGVVAEFLLEQYRCENRVEVLPGDIVIDCGACWGDSSIYFASRQAGVCICMHMNSFRPTWMFFRKILI